MNAGQRVDKPLPAIDVPPKPEPRPGVKRGTARAHPRSPTTGRTSTRAVLYA